MIRCSSCAQLKCNWTEGKCEAVYLAEQCELVVGQEAVGFVEEEVSPNELLEAPVFPLNKAVGPLALCAPVRDDGQIHCEFIDLV